MHVFVGSWDSTLSMAYGIAHSSHCASLILRGIFLGAPEDLLYLYQGNAATWADDPYALTEPGAYIKYPAEWAELLSVLTTEERGEVMKSYTAIFDMVIANAAEKESQTKAKMNWTVGAGVLSYMITERSEERREG